MKKNESQSTSPSPSPIPSQTHSEQRPDFVSKALICAKSAIDKRAERIRILDLSKSSGFCDAFVICSGRSDRQVQAIADSIQSEMKTLNIPVFSTEGYGEGRWVLIDLGEVVVHVFLEELRDYYDLESVWSDATSIPVPAEYLGSGASRLDSTLA